ncbi:hypothetical protein ACFO0N_01975 [Halobium salinum]|uniref:Small CPxCG-related zinc finger protein n=1 Tax=Halobium salinum TaxID=1364940 RepID=A0ABD5P741_9EURY|nr:hypothetical protein [Halobium salinum]
MTDAELTCDTCGESFTLNDPDGPKVACPGCGEYVTVPEDAR